MANVTMQFYSTATGDDGGHDGATFSNSGATLSYTHDHKFFFLFKSIVVPQGATIVSAYLKLRVNQDLSYAPSATIYGNNTVIPIAPTSIAEQNALALTSASVHTNADAVGSDYTSGDLSTIIQEIVSKGSWDVGKNLMITANLDSGSGEGLVVHSFDGGHVNKPCLEITWTLPSDWILLNSGVSGDDGFIEAYNLTFDSNSDHVTGGRPYSNAQYHSFFRFPSVEIAQGATVNHAYLIVDCETASSAYSGETTYFNAADNAVAPTTVAQYNALAETSGVTWRANDFLLGARIYDSGDLKTPLQEVINRAGWAVNNAVLVKLKADYGWLSSSSFNICSYDKGTRVPLLLINVEPVPLAIASFTPATGHVGTPVVITGTGFTSTPTVKFFDNVAAVVDGFTETAIYTTVPAGAATGPITVDL
jgi:hypothetical protein